MKKVLSMTLLLATVLFSSCTKTEESTDIAVKSVTIKESTSLLVGATETLVPVIAPENATNKSVTWKSSNDAIAIVKDGVITGIKEGNATITVTTTNGEKTDECAVTVTNNVVAVTGVTIKESTTIELDATETLTPVIAPENATNQSVTWKSSDDATVTVKDGVIKGIKTGTATITVTTVDGEKTDECVVTVKEIAVSGITIDKDAILLILNEEETLTATVAPENAANKAFTWSSSDPTVASINQDGVVKALKDGKTTITATTADGNKTAECKVTVEKPLINFLGTAYGTAPDFFTPLADKTNTAYVNFNPNEGYQLGTLGSIGKSALVYNKLLSDTDLKIKLTIGGGTTDAISIGYVTDPANLSTYVKVTTINYNVDMPYYILNSVTIPANGYLTIYYTPAGTWNNNSIKRFQVFAN